MGIASFLPQPAKTNSGIEISARGCIVIPARGRVDIIAQAAACIRQVLTPPNKSSLRCFFQSFRQPIRVPKDHWFCPVPYSRHSAESFRYAGRSCEYRPRSGIRSSPAENVRSGTPGSTARKIIVHLFEFAVVKIVDCGAHPDFCLVQPGTGAGDKIMGQVGFHAVLPRRTRVHKIEHAETVNTLHDGLIEAQEKAFTSK